MKSQLSDPLFVRRSTQYDKAPPTITFPTLQLLCDDHNLTSGIITTADTIFSGLIALP
jgi:hypothetical protein